jgi:ATP synthase F1 delta subunit
MMMSSSANTTFSAVEKQYANSLIEQLPEQSLLTTVGSLANTLSKVIDQTPELPPFLANHAIEAKKRAGILMELLPADTPPVLERFLTLVIENNRYTELSDILKCFHAKVNAMAGVGLVRIETAFALTADLKEALSQALKHRFSLNSVVFEELINPDFKAGLVLTYDGQRLDATLQNRISELQKLLHQV